MERQQERIRKAKNLKPARRIRRTIGVSVSAVFMICPLLAGTALAADHLPTGQNRPRYEVPVKASAHDKEFNRILGAELLSEELSSGSPDEETAEETSGEVTEETESPETTETQEPEETTTPEPEEIKEPETTTQKPSEQELTTTKEPVQEETTQKETPIEETTREETTEERTTEKETTAEETTTGEAEIEETTEETTEEETTEEDLDVYENVGLVMNDKPEKFGSLYWPLPSIYGVNCISSGYGYRTGTYSGMHAGLDIACPTGTPIYACEDGIVIASYYSDSAGNFTIIQHEGGIYTEYMHQSVRNVKQGEKVKAGQQIGLVGSTGWSTGSHLHIGVVVSDYGYDTSKRVDPLPYLTLYNKLGASIELVKQTDLIVDYTGGESLAEKTAKNAALAASLKPLFNGEKIKKVASSGFTHKGYYGTGDEKLLKKNAVAFSAEPGFNHYKDLWVRYETEDYDLLVTIGASYNSEKTACPVVVRTDVPSILVNHTAFAKKNLKKAFYQELPDENGTYYSLAVHVDIYKHGTEERVEIPELYQKLNGIDGSQAFRCLNESFDANELFSADKKALGVNRNKNKKINRITKAGDIYSEYSEEPAEEVRTVKKAVLYRKTGKMQTEGLNLVFGFRHAESTTLGFSVPEHTVTFKTNKGGEVNTQSVEVLFGESVKERISPRAQRGYRFVRWVTNQDVIVGDRVLKKGDTITLQQIKSIAVTSDLSFTARFHKK